MLQYIKFKKKKFNPKIYAKFMEENFATDYLTDTNTKTCLEVIDTKKKFNYNKSNRL